MFTGTPELMLAMIEYVAKTTNECRTAEAVRLDADLIKLMVDIVRLVGPSTLRDDCPNFCELFLAVMMREVEDAKSHGSTNQKRRAGRSAEAQGSDLLLRDAGPASPIPQHSLDGGNE